MKDMKNNSSCSNSSNEADEEVDGQKNNQEIHKKTSSILKNPGIFESQKTQKYMKGEQLEEVEEEKKKKKHPSVLKI